MKHVMHANHANHVKHARPGRQRGHMAAVVMVVLVAMMVSGVALVRSMSTNQVVAGNLAFRAATVHSSDQGVQQAATWLATVINSPVLNNSAPARGYYALDGNPNWDDEAFWSQCAACNSGPDAAGNRVAWVVHRMCSAAGDPSDPANRCARSVATGGCVGCSMSSDADVFASPARNQYRITVRVLGPRNTSTLVQTFVIL